MKKHYIFVNVCFIYITTVAQKAVVIQPVVDLIGQPLAKHTLTYDTLPVASPYVQGCPRIHQLIFNEVVEIVKESKTEYCIRIPHLFYVTHTSKKPKCYYWTNKKNLLPLHNITEKHHAYIPLPIDFRNPKKPTQNIATLLKPFHSKKLGITFSVGTRFVIKRTYKGAAIIYAFNHKTNEFIELCIAQPYYLRSNSQANITKMHTYVTLLKNWANMPGYIPYVWGGCSFTCPNKTDAFKTVSPTRQEKDKIIVIARDNQPIKNGFDCAGLIARAAQAAEIPYFYKNTHTLATHLKPVATKEELTDGDLIWIPGHVMAIGSVTKNTIIEARHYSHGYGKVHELPLRDVFQNTKTFADFFDMVTHKRPLKRLHKDRHIVQTVKHAKILSMKSCFA